MNMTLKSHLSLSMPLLGASHVAAIPANARSPETLEQCGRSHCGSGEKEKMASDQRLSVNSKTQASLVVPWCRP